MIDEAAVLNYTKGASVTRERACQQGVDLRQGEGCVYAGLREFGTVIIAPEVRMNPKAHLDDEGIMSVGQESKKSTPCSSFPVDCRYRSHPSPGVFPGNGFHPRDACRGLGRLRPHQVPVEARVPRGLEERPSVDGRAGPQRQSLRLETFDTRRKFEIVQHQQPSDSVPSQGCKHLAHLHQLLVNVQQPDFPSPMDYPP